MKKTLYAVPEISVQLFSLFFFMLVGLNCSSSYSQSWVQRGIDLDGEAADDESGRSVSLSSDGITIAIGAYHNSQTMAWAGHTRIYSWNGSAWLQKGNDIDGENAFDKSGYAVDLSSDGNTVVTGEYGSHAGGNSRGKVRVFTWNGSAWTQKGLDFIGNDYDDMGYGVALNADGNTVAFGAPFNTGIPNSNGYVKVYTWNGSAWIQKGSSINGQAAADESGHSISLSSDGNTIAIGARFNDGIGIDAGHTRIYGWNGSAWVQKGNDINGEAAYDWSGWSVSLSSDGNTVAIGAPNNQGTGAGEGHTRIYDWNGSSWQQKGNDINGEEGGESSGHSVDLSADGNTVAIGAFANDGPGTEPGSVRLYSWNGSAWIQKGGDIDGEAAGDYSGWSVSLNSNGNIVAIGAPNNNQLAGHTRIYTFGITGIFNNSLSTEINAFPNPTAGKLMIQLGEVYPDLTLTITNITGQIISSKGYKAVDEISVDIAGTPGFYFIDLKTIDGFSAILKIIKK